MNEFQKNTAHLNAAEIITEKIYLEGEEIGDAMLPKLVKRVQLSPMIDHEEVVQNNLYTLHNDAGECVYASPFLEPGINEDVTIRRRRIWKIIWGGGGGRRPRWYFLPIALPAHPGGRRRRRRRASLRYNINNLYSALTTPSYVTLKVIPPNNFKIDWRSHLVTSTRYTFQGTGLRIVRKSFPKTKDATGMYSQCAKLEEFYGSNYRSCLTTDYMFKDCVALRKFGSDTPNAFSSSTSAKEMFRGCKNLKTIELNMPHASNVTGIFRGCTSLQNIEGSNFSGVTNMESMFDGCKSLTKVYSGWKPSSVTRANYAFYDCIKLTSPTISEYKVLEQGVATYYGSGLAGTLNLACNELLNGTSMFQKCASLTAVTTSSKFNKLQIGKQMFAQCTGLQTTELNFPALTDGTNMFAGCTSLTSVTSVHFPKLQTGLGMFRDCKLDATSVESILAALRASGGMPTYYNGLSNGVVIGCDANLKGNTEWRTSIGLPATYTNDDSEIITLQVTAPANGNPSTISVRCTWN